MKKNNLLISICTLIVLFFSANFVCVEGKARPELRSQPKTIKRSYNFVHLNPDSLRNDNPLTRSLFDGWAEIRPASFMMGNNDYGPVHKVTLSKGFYMGKTEVPHWWWVEKMGNNPSFHKNCDNCPVENVSWEDVQIFIRKLNSEGNNTFRLPTEAEWEYAAREGSTGDYAGDLNSMAWYSINSGDVSHEVATKQPNAWGLYDMHGNVWEWVNDWYEEYPDNGVTDPKGPSEGYARVERSGSFNFEEPYYMRSAVRSNANSTDRSNARGFRLVQD